MDRNLLPVLYKIFRIIYLSLIGYFFLQYSHLFNTTLEKGLAFVVAVTSLAHAIIPIVKLLKPEGQDNLDNSD